MKNNKDINLKISIITVVKNNENDIENNIKSLLNQSYDNYEHIIIDGSSTDKTVDIIKKYEEQIIINNIHNLKKLIEETKIINFHQKT